MPEYILEWMFQSVLTNGRYYFPEGTVVVSNYSIRWEPAFEEHLEKHLEFPILGI